jgi:hypothetical protein
MKNELWNENIVKNSGRSLFKSTTALKYYVSGHYPSSYFYLKHRHVYISKHIVSEAEFNLRLQVKPSQLGPIYIVPISGHLYQHQDRVPTCSEIFGQLFIYV